MSRRRIPLEAPPAGSTVGSSTITPALDLCRCGLPTSACRGQHATDERVPPTPPALAERPSVFRPSPASPAPVVKDAP